MPRGFHSAGSAPRGALPAARPDARPCSPREGTGQDGEAASDPPRPLQVSDEDWLSLRGGWFEAGRPLLAADGQPAWHSFIDTWRSAKESGLGSEAALTMALARLRVQPNDEAQEEEVRRESDIEQPPLAQHLRVRTVRAALCARGVHRKRCAQT